MAPKKVQRKRTGEKMRKSITIEKKKEIIEKHERGIRVTDLASMFGMAKSTISTVLGRKEEYKNVTVAKGVVHITKSRPSLLDEVERLLLVWLNERQMAGDNLSEAMICERARTIHADLVEDSASTSDNKEIFRASKGWFHNFKVRTGIHSVLRYNEVASANKKAAEDYVKHFDNLISTNGLCSKQIFNCDETGLFWKKMPRRTYITRQENQLPGHKPIKDRLTLLLCANASGDLKIKPLLIYHSETPPVFRKQKVMKNRLGVVWRSNTKAWVTKVLFLEWIREVFCPAVKIYLEDKKLPLKALLLLDNAAAHPPDLEEELAEEFPWLIIEFLPPNKTYLLQPMEQQVMTNFKYLYTKALFQKCFQMTSETDLSLTEFWREHFNILSCVGLIEKSWSDVTQWTLISSWKNLWPQVMQEGFQTVFEPPADPVYEIVNLAESMGLEVDSDDVEHLVQAHNEELSTQELQHLLAEQQRMVAEELSEEGEEERGVPQTSSVEIMDILKKWTEVQTFVEMTHPDKAKTYRCVQLLNDNVMVYYRQLIKKRQYHSSLDKFVVKIMKTSEPDDF